VFYVCDFKEISPAETLGMISIQLVLQIRQVDNLKIVGVQGIVTFDWPHECESAN
jgi:hypothetical protein